MGSVVKVWGNADQYSLIFKQEKGGVWRASVPTDLADGQYACEFWAENAIGEQAYWSGILYVQDSRLVCIRLEEDPYQAILLPERIEAKLENDRYTVIFKRGCCCAASV